MMLLLPGVALSNHKYVNKHILTNSLTIIIITRGSKLCILHKSKGPFVSKRLWLDRAVFDYGLGLKQASLFLFCTSCPLYTAAG